MVMASSQDAWYLSLLGLAEYFRTNEPPSIKECIQCLQAVFNFKPPPRVEARTHLQLGQILLTYTTNSDLAQEHLEKAWTLSQGINGFDDVKFEAASTISDLYVQQTRSDLSKEILKKAIELSRHHIYWHFRLLFQLAQIHANEKDYDTAGTLLTMGVDYAHLSNATYTKVLFLLSRVMLLLIERKTSDVPPLLAQAGHLVETWNGSVHQKEYLKLFFLVLQVCQYLMNGQVKSVKPCLKQLQQSIQLITAPNWPSDAVICGPNVCDMFIWMPKDYLYVLVYLVTVMHSMLSGYMDKAQKYTNKAWTQIEKLKMADNKPILSIFQILLLEHIVMCRLVMGSKTLALQEISQASLILKKNPSLMDRHKFQLRVLLGLYAMSMNCMEASEAQFIVVLNNSNDKELWTFASLNLAIVYLRTKREADFLALHDRINPENIQSCSHSLRAASYYVQGLQSFFQARYHEAKKHLRETLKMANAEDLNRLTSCSLVLLGHIFLSLGNSRESMNMVTPAMQLASKIPDVHVQLWASAILKDLYRICGDPNKENEAYNMHCTFSHTLLNDHFQATQMCEHNLISWIDGDIPINESNVPVVQNIVNCPLTVTSGTSLTSSVATNHVNIPTSSKNNNINDILQ